MEPKPINPKENKTSGQTQFNFVMPNELIEKQGFVGAFWGEIPDEQTPNQLLVREKLQKVTVFGFQSLTGEEAAIDLHPEKTQTELTYILQGKMNMEIANIYEETVFSLMEGQIPLDADLNQASFIITENGLLYVTCGGPLKPTCYVVKPTVTPKGSLHATKPEGDCIYLAVKVSEQS